MIAWLAPVGGLAVLAGVPLAIHLLSRQSRRERPFPALALLFRASGGRARISALRERLAMMARILALIALLLAASAPVLRTTWSTPGAPVVVVIDASASMRQRVNAASAWTAAIGTAGRLADELAPRPLQLLVAGVPLRRSAPKPESDRGSVRALLADAQPGWGAGSLETAIAAAITTLNNRGDLYVITDGSRNALAGVDATALPSGIAWHQISVCDGSLGNANYAVRAIAVEPGSGRVGQPLNVRAEVANFSNTTAELTVRLDLGGDAREQHLSIAPGSSASFARAFTPTVAGRLDLDAAIVARDGSALGTSDALPEDDRRCGTVTVVAGEPLRLYTDADQRDQVGVARPLLAAARAAGLLVTVRPGSSIAGDLRDSDGSMLVITAGLAGGSPTTETGTALLEHLRHGGVWMQVTASDADARLTAAGIDPPAKPGALVDLSSKPRGLLLGARKLDHPLTAGLLGREPLLARLEAWRYRPAPPQPGSTVLLGWADGSAALALRPIGPGWWVQLGISPADGDTSLAALEVLPLVIAHLSDVGGLRRLADAAVPCDSVRRAITARDPSGKTLGTSSETADGSVRLDHPGRWMLDGAAVAVAIPAGESDLRPMAEVLATPGEHSAAAALAGLGDRPLWPWCLVAVAVLLASELLLVGGLPQRIKPAASLRNSSAP